MGGETDEAKEEEDQPLPDFDPPPDDDDEEPAQEKRPASSPRQKRCRKKKKTSSSPATTAMAARAAAAAAATTATTTATTTVTTATTTATATATTETAKDANKLPLPPPLPLRLTWLDEDTAPAVAVVVGAPDSTASAAGAGVPAAAAVVGNTQSINGQMYRTISVIRKEREEQGLIYDEGFPNVSFPSFDAIVNAVNTWHTNVTGYTVVKASKQAATSRRGCRGLVRCKRAGKYSPSEKDGSRPNKSTKKCDCPWMLWMEEAANEGRVVWVVSRMDTTAVNYAKAQDLEYVHLCHNHTFITGIERLIDPGNRSIPEAVKSYADAMQEAHLPPAKIYRNLVEKCRKLNIDVTFMKKDVANMYPSENKSLDCSECIEHLQQRKKDDDTLDYIFYTEEDGTLERIFFVLKDGKEILLQQGSDTVILFDTKHGTNQYGHKLGCFCTIDAHGKTRIIAAVFLLFEDENSFNWTFKAFEDAFGGAPKILFTDQDVAMGLAIAAIWSITIHLLCTFHIWKNFWKHIKPLFGEKKTAEWREVAKHWWKLCKNSDTTAIASFDSDWRSFVSYIEENCNPEKFDSNKRTWLEGLKDLAPKWAACYTWQHQSYGIHSTQRAEAANSAIASFCSKNSKILTITNDLEQLADTQGLESEVDKIRKTIFRDVTDKDLSPLAMFLTTGLHPWAKRLVVGQDDQKVHYQCKEVPGKVGIFWVERMVADLTCFTTKEDQKELERAIDHGVGKSSFTRHETSLSSCSCQYGKCYGGLPCRH